VLWTVVLALGLQIACGDAATAPSPTSGVTVYQHPDFGGDSYTFVDRFHNFQDLNGPCATPDSPSLSWNNCVSSIKIAEGWEATAYERDDYAGQTLTISSDFMDLDDEPGPSSCGDDWDDCISSIEVREVVFV
jgi:hypothetical protein